MYNSHDLAILIKSRAKEKNIAIKDMLSDLSLGSNTMSGLYHGKSIAFDSLARIADYLDCSVDYLLGRAGKSSDNLVIEDSYEPELIEKFRSLSEQGQEYIMETLDMAVLRYKKGDLSEFSEKKAN